MYRLGNYRVLLLSLLLLCCLLAAGDSKFCLESNDCDDGSSCTIDFCIKRIRRCLHHYVKKKSKCTRKGLTPSKDTLITYSRDKLVVLKSKDRLAILDAAIRVLRDVHPHRRLHLANGPGEDPVKPLNKLKEQTKEDIKKDRDFRLSTQEFHAALVRIFEDVRDLHTLYLRPWPMRGAVAFLPLTIQEYYVSGVGEMRSRRFVVTDVAVGAKFEKKSFGVGAEIVAWDGKKIEDVVDGASERSSGANPESRLQQGLQRLTLRFLEAQSLPKERDIKIKYISKDGRPGSVSVDWLYTWLDKKMPLSNACISCTGTAGQSKKNGSSWSQDIRDAAEEQEESNASQQLTKPTSLLSLTNRRAVSSLVPEKEKSKKEDDRITRDKVKVSKDYHDAFYVEKVKTKHGDFGIIRIYSFFHKNYFGFANEFLRLVHELKPYELVIDVRGNTGGTVVLSQILVQLLTKNEIEPVSFAFHVTKTTAKMFSQGSFQNAGLKQDVLSKYNRSMKAARALNDPYSASLPEISRATVNSYRGTRHNCKVLVLADGGTHGAAEVFAATVQDARAGDVMVAGASTSGGGGTVVRYMRTLTRGWPTLFPALPKDVEIMTAFRRIYRTHENAGIPLEMFGVKPDIRYYPTLWDRMHHDEDLMEEIAKHLTKSVMNTPEAIPRDEYSMMFATRTPAPEQVDAPAPSVKPLTSSVKKPQYKWPFRPLNGLFSLFGARSESSPASADNGFTIDTI